MKLYELAVKKPVIIMIGLITLFPICAISAYKLPIEFLPRVELSFIGVLIPYDNSHPDHFDVNVRCLDGDLLRRFDVRAFDGRNWEQNVDTLRDDSR